MKRTYIIGVSVIFSILLVFAKAGAVFATEPPHHEEQEIGALMDPGFRDPVVQDSDKVGGEYDPYIDAAYVYISGKASQLYPPLLYNIRKYAIAYPQCHLVYTTGTPGTVAYGFAWIHAETTCGELSAEIHWIEGHGAMGTANEESTSTN